MSGPFLGGKSDTLFITSINIKQHIRLQIAPVQQPFKKINVYRHDSTLLVIDYDTQAVLKRNPKLYYVRPLNDSISFSFKRYRSQCHKACFNFLRYIPCKSETEIKGNSSEFHGGPLAILSKVAYHQINKY